MNKYGYFRYDDIAVGAKERATFSTVTELQPGSAVDSLKEGVTPYDFASLETDTYITATPKRLADDEPLGFAPSFVSGADGRFSDGYPAISIYFGQNAPFVTYGVTIHAENVLKDVRIQLSTLDGLLDYTFAATGKNEFFSWDAVKTGGIIIRIRAIDKPGAFLRIYGIDFGRTVTFDDASVISAQMHSTFPLTGESLEYDTLDLHVLYDNRHGFFFQRRQPLSYIGADGRVKKVFYVDRGNTVETEQGAERAYTAKISAYDETANMEDTFLGGMYDNVPVGTLLADIMGDIPYTMQGADGMTMTGYIPISTRREALMLVCRGCNLRPYRGASMTIKPIEMSQSAVLSRANIVDAPTIDTTDEQINLVLQVHHYAKGTEEKEVYHWYISKTYPVTITWSEPVHSIRAYEVTGVDENGNDIVSESESTAVTFSVRNANYCTVKNTSDNKIVIKGLLYTDSTEELERSSAPEEVYQTVNTVTIDDQTIIGDPETVLDTLYDAYARNATVTAQYVNVPDDNGESQGVPHPGQRAAVLGAQRTVTSVTDTLCGLYDLEAT